MMNKDKGEEGFRNLNEALVEKYGSVENYHPKSKPNGLPKTFITARRSRLFEYCRKTRWIGAGLFVASLIFFLHAVWISNDEKKPVFGSKLLMANIFIRHGDRAPIGKMPRGDKHANNITLFWPNGLNNLTDIGKYRMYKVGLETRRHYQRYIDYDSEHILAFSSPHYRCINSMQFILQGLYNIEFSQEKGRALIREMNSCTNKFNQCVSLLSTGSGSPDEWRKVRIDSTSLPTLYDDFLMYCAYTINNPSPIRINLMNSINIRSLPNIESFRDMLMSKYGSFNTSSLGIFSTILAELGVIRTVDTYNYTDHFNGWIDEVIIAKPHYNITLFDLFEQVNVFAYRDRQVGIANRIQTGHLISSVIESQLLALGNEATSVRMEKYRNKKMILYTSHDTVVHQILHVLKVVNINSPFEDRFSKWHKSQDGVSGLLSGLKMPSYGMSIRFELWELKSLTDNNKFKFVQLSIYNEDDIKFRNIHYSNIDFGTACNRLFKEKYPKSPSDQLSSFYKTSFQYDEKRYCPFELFRNVTSDILISDMEVHQLCDTSKYSSTFQYFGPRFKELLAHSSNDWLLFDGISRQSHRLLSPSSERQIPRLK